MSKNRLLSIACIVAVFYVAGAVAAQAQTLTTIASFKVSSSPFQLIEGNGNLFGITEFGGKNGWGDVFEMNLSGRQHAVYNFCSQSSCTDGKLPVQIFQAPNGTIYGATEDGGLGSGTVFAIAPNGKESVLYDFCSKPACPGAPTELGPVPSVNGRLLVATAFLKSGGIPTGGALFELTTAGQFSPLYNFCANSNCTAGSAPSSPPLQTADGSIYGMTNSGGADNGGYVYKLTTSGQLVILYSFAPVGLGGPGPFKLIQGADGNFYGLTEFGGPAGAGSVFEITPQGQFTSLYNFCAQVSCADGIAPQDMVQGSDGNFYGVTFGGGGNENCGGDSHAPVNSGCGTIFELTPHGVRTTLYSFCQQFNCADGVSPISLIQDTNGMFYGITAGDVRSRGGSTAFSFSTGLAPFVSPNPIWRKVGGTIDIVGHSLTRTTSVTFNGVPANFKVESDTLIHATVPTGATTGKIAVTTPTGTLTSNLPFQVLP